MSKFCQNCGKALGDADRFCDGCGASQEIAPAPQQPVSQPVQSEAPQPVQPEAPVATAPKAPKANFDLNKIIDQVKTFANGVVERCKADKKYMYTCIGIAAAVVLVLVLLLVLVFGGSAAYTKPIDSAIDVFYEGNFKKMEKLAPKEYFEYVEDEQDTDIDEMIEDLEDSYEDVIEALEDEYGKDYKVTYEVTREKELSDRKLEGIADALADEYDIKEKKVTAGYDLKVKVTIKGSDDDADEKVELSVIKYDGTWYLIDWEEDDDDYYADFDPSGIMVWDFLY